MPALDHLVLASPDPEATRDLLAERTGIVLGAGGAHVGRGTCNWLGRLGPTSYLELIGPDRDQPEPSAPRPFGIDDLPAATLVTWCARPDDLDGLRAAAAAAGLAIAEPYSMERDAPTGRLRWRLAHPEFDPQGGIVPFFIDWGDTAHPAMTSTEGLRAADFRAEHPDPVAVSATLAALGVDLPIAPGPTARLLVTLAGPAGSVEFGR